MNSLNATSSLIVHQKKEWGEILTGFETKNRYAIQTQDARELYFAAEVKGNFLIRMWLKAWRPFEMMVYDNAQQIVLKLKSPFRFYFREISIYDANDRLLGKVVREFSILRRKYKIYDNTGKEIFNLFGPILHPWTFNILQGSREIGKITKKFSGILKEAFTDADNFGVSYPQELDNQKKAILLGAVFLIDFVHFENKNNN